MPKISVRVVPRLPPRLLCARSSPRSFGPASLCRVAPPKPAADGGVPRRRPSAAYRAGCARPDRPKATRLPTGEEVPQEPVEAIERPGALCNQVFAPLGKQAQHLRANLGIYRRQEHVARGCQGGGEGIDPIVLAGVAGRKHSNPRRKLRRHVHHEFAGRYQPPRQVPTETASVLYSQRRSGYRFAQRSRALRPVQSCGKVARSRSSPLASSIAATANDALWGSTPMSTFMSARTSVSVGPLCHWRTKDIPTSGGAPIPLLSHSTRRGRRRDASLEQANPSCGRQEVRERSLYDGDLEA